MTDTGATGPKDAPQAPAIVERFVKALNITYKAVRLYPGMSEIPRESAVAAVAALRTIFESQPVVRFVVTRDGLFYDGAYALPDSPAYRSFARDLYARNLSEVRFHAGCGETDIVHFLMVAAKTPDELLESGGFESGLWDLDVTTITVAESVKRIVDDSALGESEQGEEGELEPWPPSPERLEEIVAQAAAGQHREQRLLVRLTKDPGLLERFLGVGEDAARRPAADAMIASKVEALARGVNNEVPPEREELLRAIAEAVLDLEPEVRQRLVTKRLLGSARRGDEGMTAVLRELSFQELMDCVLFGMEETAEARAGVARAIRSMSLIGLTAPAHSILEDAAGEMTARGMGDAFVRSVIDRAAPRRIDIHPRAQQSTLDPVDSVLRLIDLTPARGDAAHAYDEPVAVLREEASRGLSDGDVMAALVTVTALETRPEHIRVLSKLVEDRIAYLMDLQEFEVAADAAATLIAAEQNVKLPQEQRARMRELLKLLSGPDSMRKVTTAMRVFVHESSEYAACRRLLAALGPYTVPALLEVLAEEQDMTGRKVIVDLLSGKADRFVPELAACLDDKRWYFVRNVVAILGSIHDPATLQHLGRTLRHADERVRRETIRAIAGIRDALATEMLGAALSDESAQNVQLAARYLGGIGGRGVLTALEQVAKGEGRGNRDLGPRVEAMEALGRVGGPSSLAVLNDIARQRGLLASRTREVRTAAEAAIAALHARGVTGGSAQ